MTNEDLMILILDKLDWDYDKELNPNRYSNTKVVYAGDLILGLLNSKVATKASLEMGFSYKVINTSIQRYLTPIFGRLNGGEETWYYALTHFIRVKPCSSCKKLLSYDLFHKDSCMSRGVNSSCKECRITENALMYKKDSVKDSHERSYDKHRADIKARQQLYKGQRSLRVPPWYDLQEALIIDFYANCPKGMHVDHKWPLKGAEISGLHVIDNLQYLSAEDNLKKGNKLDLVTYPI